MQLKKIPQLLFLALIILVPSYAAGVEKPTVVMLFGDSITVGYNEHTNFFGLFGNGTNNIDTLPIDLGAPTMETSALLNDAESKRTSVVVNWGVGGSTSVQGASRMSLNLAQTKGAHDGKAYIALILYGTNDVGQNISASTTKFNISEMIKDADDMGFTPVIGTLTPRSDRSVVGQNIQIMQAPAMAGRGPVTVVDHYANFISQGAPCASPLFTPEPAINDICLHPNSTGYQAIAQGWFNSALASLIEPDPVIQPDPVVIAPIISLLLDD